MFVYFRDNGNRRNISFQTIDAVVVIGGCFVFKIREAYTVINELKVFKEDVQKQVAAGMWQPVIDMFKTEPKPGYRGPDGRPYISLHYIMKKV